jgi:PAS domain S-box-containing protein
MTEFLIQRLKQLPLRVLASGTILLVLLVTALWLSLWCAEEMRSVVRKQFNQEQLALAGNVSNSIERQWSLLRHQIRLTRSEIQSTPVLLRQKILRFQENTGLNKGVTRIELVAEDSLLWDTLHLSNPGHISRDQVSLSPVFENEGKLYMTAAIRYDQSSVLAFTLLLQSFVVPFVSSIRSGQTGYAWLIDAGGSFLYHPDQSFIGQNAFTIRTERDPNISYRKINFIQKEKMLAGKTGTGWYTSGWHRGKTGQMKKLIAYSPVAISDIPENQWSVAVVAPIFEVEDVVSSALARLFWLQGFVLFLILCAGGIHVWLERRHSKRLSFEVDERTRDLRKSEEKYRSLVESAEDLIFTVDKSGEILSLNSYTAHFFGGSPSEFVHQPLSSLFPHKAAHHQLHLISLVYQNRKSIREEFQIQLEEHQYWLSAHFMPLRDDYRAVRAVLCIARDVTENKKLEKQLINAEKLASMGTLAAGVAHEINNPLAVMLGFCDLLLEKHQPGHPLHDDLKTIERQGLHCKQVVENLLSFARIEETEQASCSLRDCLEQILQVVRHTLEMQDIELSVQFETQQEVRGSSRELQQVFLNLINNAIAAMPYGGALSIQALEDKQLGKALIMISDTGPGISEDNRDRIFEPFFTTKP